MLDVPRQGKLGFNFEVAIPGLRDAPEFFAQVRRAAKSQADHVDFQNILVTRGWCSCFEFKQNSLEGA